MPWARSESERGRDTAVCLGDGRRKGRARLSMFHRGGTRLVGNGLLWLYESGADLDVWKVAKGDLA